MRRNPPASQGATREHIRSDLRPGSNAGWWVEAKQIVSIHFWTTPNSSCGNESLEKQRQHKQQSEQGVPRVAGPGNREQIHQYDACQKP